MVSNALRISRISLLGTSGALYFAMATGLLSATAAYFLPLFIVATAALVSGMSVLAIETVLKNKRHNSKNQKRSENEISNSKYFSCKICGLDFDNIEKLEHHERKHDNGKPTLGSDQFFSPGGIASGGAGAGGF